MIKDESEDIFMKHKAGVGNQLDRKIKRLRLIGMINNGSNKLNQFFEKHEIPSDKNKCHWTETCSRTYGHRDPHLSIGYK